MSLRKWRNKKGWQLTLIWFEKQGGRIQVYNPHTKEVHTLREYEYWQGHLAVQTAELVAQSMGAKEVVVERAA